MSLFVYSDQLFCFELTCLLKKKKTFVMEIFFFSTFFFRFFLMEQKATEIKSCLIRIDDILERGDDFSELLSVLVVLKQLCRELDEESLKCQVCLDDSQIRSSRIALTTATILDQKALMENEQLVVENMMDEEQFEGEVKKIVSELECRQKTIQSLESIRSEAKEAEKDIQELEKMKQRAERESKLDVFAALESLRLKVSGLLEKI